MTEERGILLPVIEAVDELCRSKGHIVLAIDGMSNSGKTTASRLLSELWDAPVVHMDDFYLPKELRTRERLAEPGGNVHYERFEQEVLPGLRSGAAFSYRVFDCETMDYACTADVAPSPVRIVEGAYALHPRFGDYADIRVFFGIGKEEQMRRVIGREGAQGWESFRDRWIPMENAYHAACRTRERADIVVMQS